VTTRVINQHLGYWLLSNALTSTIKLYLKLSKERLELQAKINAIKEMNMRMKVKQLGANMQGQTNIILDFMFFKNPTKVYNIVVLMLDP
jgi:hypothetical protein